MISKTFPELTPEAKKRLWLLFAFAALVRAGVFVLLCVHPVANEIGQMISPLSFMAQGDFGQYYAYSKIYSAGWDEIVEAYRISAHGFLTGPFLPYLIALFRYEDGNTLPLSLFYICIEWLTLCGWLWWFSRRGLHWLGLLGLCLIPNPVWYAMTLSVDTIFAAWTTFLIFLYWSRGQNKWIWLLCMVLGLVSITIRPNGLSYVAYFFLELLLLQNLLSRRNTLITGAILAVFMAFVLYSYTPYLLNHLHNSARLDYYGITQGQYLGGLYSALPEWLNYSLSYMQLFIVKIPYLLGLRPSFSNTNDILVVIRSLPGLITLPGLFYLYWKGSNRWRLFMTVFLLPILPGSTQERYVVPILPILYWFGCQFYLDTWGWLRGRKGASAISQAS